MSDKESQIAKIKAELAADAAKAKARQDAAYAKAKAKPARTDAEIMKGAKKQGVDTGSEAPKNKGKLAERVSTRATVDVNADTQVLGPKQSAGTTASAPAKAPKAGRTVIGGNMNIPQGDTRVFDFEAKPKLNLVTNDAPTDVPTQTYKQPKAQKGKLAKAAQTAKAPSAIPGTQSTAAPELPNRPLPGQGSMEGKPVEKVTVKVSDKLITKEGVAKWNAANDADRRITQGSAPQAERRAALQAQKVITPAGVIEPTPSAVAAKPQTNSVADAMRASMRSGRGAASWKVDDEVKAAYEASLRMGRRAMQSTGQKAAGAAGTAVAKGAKWAASTTGKALIGTVKAVTEPVWKPITKFAEGRASRKAAHVAADAAVDSATGLRGRVAARAAQGMATARTAGAVGMMGGRLAVGGAKMAAEGVAAAVLWKIGEGAALAETSSRAAMNQQVRSGKKQGLEVTHAEPSFARMAFGGSPKIKVHDPSQDVDPSTGKSLSQKRREQGEYVRLKKAAGRNIITGSYKPKGGNEQV